MKHGEAIEFLNKNMQESKLETFGIRAQFYIIEFINEKYEEIKFYIDCKFYMKNSLIKTKVEEFRKVDSDVYEIIYFIYLILREFEACNFTSEKKFELNFKNDDPLVFDLNSNEEYPSELIITFKKRVIDKEYYRIEINKYDCSISYIEMV